MTVDINLYEGFVSITWAQLGQGQMGHIPPFFRLGNANYYVGISALFNSFVALQLTVAYGVKQTWRRSFALQSMRNATIGSCAFKQLKRRRFKIKSLHGTFL